MDSVVSVKMGVVALCVLLHVHSVSSSEELDQVVISRTFVLPSYGSDNVVAEDFVGPKARMKRADYLSLMVGSSERRVKRSAYRNQDVDRFNEEEKKILVNKHNEYRKLARSSDMMYMYWDDDAAAFAQEHADKCSFSHSSGVSRKNIGPYAMLGENLYAGSGSYDPGFLVKMWYDEISDFNYNTLGCTNVCGHYTQVVWANSFAVGCGVRYCPKLDNVNFGKGFLVSCNYGPAGNYRGVKPYKKGEPCSACDPKSIYCVQDMCARYPVVGSSIAPTRGPPVLVLIGCGALSTMLSLVIL